jgi:hypothetical protein
MPYITSIQKLLIMNGTTSYSLKKVVSSGYMDDSDPTKGPEKTTTTYPLLSYPGQYKESQIDGELVRVDDIKLYIDPSELTVVPTESDIIVKSSEEYRIKNVKTYTQGDTVLLYILRIRK